MRCLPGSLSGRTAQWPFRSHTSPRGGDTHAPLNSSRVTSPRAWSLPPARQPELSCREAQRGAWGGWGINILSLSKKKDAFLSNEAMLLTERKRSGIAGMQGRRAATTSCCGSSRSGCWTRSCSRAGLALPLDQSRRPSTAARAPASGLAQAAPSPFHSQKRPMKEKTQTTEGSLMPFPRHGHGCSASSWNRLSSTRNSNNPPYCKLQDPKPPTCRDKLGR